MHLSRVAILGLVSVAAQPVLAETPIMAVGVKVGVQGVSIQARPRLSDELFTRLNFSIANASVDLEGEDGSLTYDASFSSKALGALFDWHPWGSFRFTAGVHVTDTTGNGTAVCNEITCTVGDETVTPLQLGTISMEFDAGDQSLLLGIGVTTNRNEVGWGFDAEVGVVWQPDVSVELSASGGFCQVDPMCQAGLAEDEKTIEDRLHFVPVASIGVLYSF